MSKEDDNESEDISDILSSASIVFIGRVSKIGFGFLGAILIARLLGPNEFGTIALGLLLMNSLAIVGTLGTNTGLTRYLPRSNSLAYSRELILSAATVCIPFALILGGLGYLNSEYISSVLFNDPTLSKVISIFCIGIPITTSAKILEGIIRGYEDGKAKVIIYNFAKPISKLIAIVVVLFIGIGASGVAVAYVCGFAIAGILSTVWLKSKIGVLYNSEIKYQPDFYRFSIPLMFTALMTMSFTNIDRLFLGVYTSTEMVGIYDAVYKLAIALLIISNAFNFIFQPRFSKLDSNERFDDMVVIYQKITKWSIGITLPLFVIFVTFPEVIIQMSFGKQFISGSPILVVLSTGVFTHVASGLNRSAMKAIGSAKRVTYGTALAFIGNIIGNLLLIPSYGGMGAAIATATSYLIWNVYYLITLYIERSIIPISQKSFMYFSLNIILYIVIGNVFRQLDLSSELIEMTTFSIILLTTYILSLRMFGIVDKSEVQRIKNVARSII